MILKLYVVRDEVAIENRVLLYEQNDTLLKRNLKALLLDQKPNYINQNTKDKRVYYVGDLNTETGVIKGLDPIVSVYSLEEVRLELIDEINIAKAQAIASKENAAAKFNVPVEKLDEVENNA